MICLVFLDVSKLLLYALGIQLAGYFWQLPLQPPQILHPQLLLPSHNIIDCQPLKFVFQTCKKKVL
jgi:hypothetical protein